jgi:hypothetical protein
VSHQPDEKSVAKIAALLPALREAGIEEVTVRYDGEDGEGTIDFISPDSLPEKLGNELEDCIYNLLPDG